MEKLPPTFDRTHRVYLNESTKQTDYGEQGLPWAIAAIFIAAKITDQRDSCAHSTGDHDDHRISASQ